MEMYLVFFLTLLLVLIEILHQSFSTYIQNFLSLFQSIQCHSALFVSAFCEICAEIKKGFKAFGQLAKGLKCRNLKLFNHCVNCLIIIN